MRTITRPVSFACMRQAWLVHTRPHWLHWCERKFHLQEKQLGKHIYWMLLSNRNPLISILQMVIIWVRHWVARVTSNGFPGWNSIHSLGSSCLVHSLGFLFLDYIPVDRRVFHFPNSLMMETDSLMSVCTLLYQSTCTCFISEACDCQGDQHSLWSAL